MQAFITFVLSNFTLTFLVLGLIAAENFAPGNAGVIFYSDIGIPAAGFVLLCLQYRLARESTSPERAPGEVAEA